MMNKIKQLRERHTSKQLRIHKINCKPDLISVIVDVLNKQLPDDMNEIFNFGFNFDKALPLDNADYHCSYLSLETNDEYQERMIIQRMSNEKKTIQLNLLARELGYRLEKFDKEEQDD